jgi:hypothetical protein
MRSGTTDGNHRGFHRRLARLAGRHVRAQGIKAIAIVVLGWTTVTTLASIPNVSVYGVLVTLALRTLLIAVPYTVGVLLRRWRKRRR